MASLEFPYVGDPHMFFPFLRLPNTALHRSSASAYGTGKSGRTITPGSGCSGHEMPRGVSAGVGNGKDKSEAEGPRFRSSTLLLLGGGSGGGGGGGGRG